MTDLFLPTAKLRKRFVRTQALTPESARCPLLTCMRTVRTGYQYHCCVIVSFGIARSRSTGLCQSNHRLARIIKLLPISSSQAFQSAYPFFFEYKTFFFASPPHR